MNETRKPPNRPRLNDCDQFQQQLDQCLDDRLAVKSLASDGHLRSCGKCQTAFDVYRQFPLGGPAVLNGGDTSESTALDLGRLNRSGHPITHRFKSATQSSAAIVAAAIAIAVLISAFNAKGEKEIASTSPAATKIRHDENDLRSQRFGQYDGGQFKSAARSIFSKANGFAKSHFETHDFQPIKIEANHRSVLIPLAAFGDIRHGLSNYRLPRPLEGFQSPLFYTSELPGIRPLHRSMNVAMVALPLERLIAIE